MPRPGLQLLLYGRELAVAAAELGYRGRPESLLRELLAYAANTGLALERVQLLSALDNILSREQRWNEADGLQPRRPTDRAHSA